MSFFGSSEPRFYLLAALEEEVLCPVSYVRIVNHLQHAPSNWQSSVFVLPRDLEAALQELPKCSGVLLARATSSAAAELASRARALGLPVVYDIDDYLWKLPDYVVTRELSEGIGQVISKATLVTTPSRELGDFVKRLYPAPISIVPNAADIFCDHPRKREVGAILANSDFFRLPKMKKEFFEAVRDGARAAGVKLWLYYLSNDAPETLSDDPHLQIIWCGVRSYSSYRVLLERIRPELALVPLPDDHFSRYKSVVKFAEFGHHSTAGIYSRVEPYVSFVREGEDGWLTDNDPGAWRDAITRVLSLTEFEFNRVRSVASAKSRKEFNGKAVRSKLFSALEHAGLKAINGAQPAQPPPPEVEFTFREAYDYLVGHRAALMWENERLREIENSVSRITAERDALLVEREQILKDRI
jgi:hypothetical protein